MSELINRGRPRVLLVPDSSYWILGTIAKAISTSNRGIETTIVSGPILDRFASKDDRFFDRFDLVHFICPYASQRWLPMLRDNLPVVTSHHHVTDWARISHNIDGDAIVTGSMQWADDIVARGADAARVVSVPYGVDTQLFRPPKNNESAQRKQQIGLDGAAPVVGFFAKRGSNDDDRKGIDVFTEGVKHLKALVPDVAVLIVGPGWRQLVQELRAAEIRCKWFPFIENMRDLAPLYHALDFYWVTARVEGGPVPLLEAMSSGVCCLSTRVGLARELVNDGENAVFLPMNDPEAFAATTARLWDDSESRRQLGAQGRACVVREMDSAKTLARMSSVYDTAAGTFFKRTGRSVASFSTPGERQAPTNAKAVRSDALNASERKRVRMLEALEWSENLVLYQRQHAAAFRLITKTWLQNPMSIEPPRTILRRFLPAPLVRAVVKARHSLMRGSPSSVDSSGAGGR
ncbi:MAG TPA: glycosyltransferase family 4 protein [Gemmatimonadaceae bacterium]|nr:glycosyltransferase family 4 protein [Gemmatimonadaceae bacterium]